MPCMILGLTEGKNYPIRKDNETVLDLSHMDNILVVDMDYFLNHISEIKDSMINVNSSNAQM